MRFDEEIFIVLRTGYRATRLSTLITRFVTDRYDVVQLSDQFHSCFILHSSDIRYRSSNHTQSLPATGNKNNFSFLTINVYIHFATFDQYCETLYKDIVENFRKKEREKKISRGSLHHEDISSTRRHIVTSARLMIVVSP